MFLNPEYSVIDLFTVFFLTFHMDNLGKMCRHHWKERFNISNIAQFESHLLNINENITP